MNGFLKKSTKQFIATLAWFALVCSTTTASPLEDDVDWETMLADHERLREFVTTVTVKASNPKKAYDYSGILGLHNRSATPESPGEIAHEYTCTTLVQAALHYAGKPTCSIHRSGFLDIVTPAQIIRSGRRE